MSTTIRGTLEPKLQSRYRDYDPMRGYIYGYEYKGASQEQMETLQANYIAAGVACRIIYHQGDTATLEVQDATNETPIDVWELLGNTESRDNLANPRFQNTLIGGTPSIDPEKVGASMLKYLEQYTDPTILFGFGGGLYGSPAIVERTYRRRMSGQTEYRRGQYVLQHRTNVSNRWSVNVADVGVDCIYTPAQLITEISDSLLWTFPCPGRLQYKISHITAPTTRAGYQWGWLKSSSMEVTAAHNRVDIITEYVLELWNTDDYAPY